MYRIVVALALLARIAEAHQTSIKYVDLVVQDDQVEVTLRCAASDLTEPMQLAADATPSVTAATAHPAVPAYMQRWVGLPGCTITKPVARAADAKFVAVSWTATCAKPGELHLDFTAFFALDARHEAFVQLVAPGKQAVQTIVRAGERQVTLRPGEARTVLYWIRDGIGHIVDLEAKDHMCFVLALLLVVMLYRGQGSWHVRAFWPTLKSTALVVTAFTVAHSLSLIAASLGFISLESRIVELLIAASIAYTAAEDIVRPDVPWRFLLTFAFGLVHGLGFAGQLAVQLPPSDVVIPLLCFNIGVELGQLAIVVVALPILFAIARGLGGDRYRRIALPVLGGAIFVVGIIMFVERI